MSARADDLSVAPTAITSLIGNTPLVEIRSWKDELLKDPTQLVPAYLASAQAQGLWNGPGDERRR